MITALSASDRYIYEKKMEFFINNFKAIGIEQKEFIEMVQKAGLKLDRSDLSKMLNRKQKLANRWLPIFDFAEPLINAELEKAEALKNKN